MKFEVRDLKKLRWQLAIAAALIAGAGAIAYLSLVTTQKANAEHRAAAAYHAQIDARLRQVRIEEEEIKNRAALFTRLQENGVLGAERRLDWVELLREIQRSLRLPGINYEFSPLKPLDGKGGGSFYASSMKLHLLLLHEGDLLNFLSRLQQEAKAMVLVRNCSLTRTAPGGGATEASPAQLSADCEIDWVTAQVSGARTP